MSYGSLHANMTKTFQNEVFLIGSKMSPCIMLQDGLSVNLKCKLQPPKMIYFYLLRARLPKEDRAIWDEVIRYWKYFSRNCLVNTRLKPFSVQDSIENLKIKSLIQELIFLCLYLHFHNQIMIIKFWDIVTEVGHSKNVHTFQVAFPNPLFNVLSEVTN